MVQGFRVWQLTADGAPRLHWPEHDYSNMTSRRFSFEVLDSTKHAFSPSASVLRAAMAAKGKASASQSWLSLILGS